MPLTFEQKLSYLGLALVAGAACYGLFLLIKRFIQDLRIDNALSKIPMPSGCLPFFGHALSLAAGRPWDVINIDFPQQLKSPIVRFNMFRHRVILFSEPPLLERVLQTQQRKYIKDRNSFEEFMCLLGNGLVTSEGAKWRHGRTLLSSAMRIEILEDLPEIAIDCTNILLRDLKANPKGFDLMKGFHRLTLQVIGRAILSLSPEECETVFARLYLPIVDECNARVWAPWRKVMFWLEGFKERAACLDKLNTYFVDLIQKRWAERQSGKRNAEDGVKQDILDLYMSQLGKMDPATVLQLRDDLKTMILAGHETTAAMLTWTCYEVLSNPEVLQKVRDEHREFFSTFDIKNKKQYPTLKDLEKKVYGRSCLREALRKYSVVPIVMRVANEDDFIRKEESGLAHDLSIPAGTAVCVGITAVHNNPTLWPDPRKYNPERFVALDSDMDAVKYSFLPFIAGPRNCLGQHLSLTEAQFILSYLMHHAKGLQLNPEASGVPHKFIAPVVPEKGLPVDVDEVKLIF